MKWIFSLLFLVFLCLNSNGYAQTSTSFWARYQSYQRMLLQNVDNTERFLLDKLNSMNSDDDTTALLCNLILFDIYELSENTVLLKEYGLKLKAQEILFDAIEIKNLISLRFRKTMFYIRDEFSFEQNITDKISRGKSIKDYHYVASMNSIMSRFKASVNQRDSSIYYMNAAQVYARKQSDKTLLVNILIDQAKIYKRFNNDDISTSKAYVALQLASEINYKLGSYKANLMLAELNLQNENYKDFDNHLLQSNLLAKSIQYRRGVILTELIGLKSKAVYYPSDHAKIEKLKTQIKEQDFELQGLLFLVEGKIYKLEGEYAEAINKFNLGIVEQEKLGNIFGIQVVYRELAEVFVHQKKYDKALNYISKAQELLISLNEYAEYANLFKQSAEILERKGEKAKAYDFLKKYTILNDSLQLSDIQSNLFILQQRSKEDQRERLITLQSDSIKSQIKEKEYTNTMLENIKLKNDLKTYIIIGFLGLVVLGGIILFFKWNQNLIQQRQREAEMNQTLLRTQMNPHFVFNAMSVIQSYIYDNDTKNSTKFLVNFSKLMRLILENSSKEFIPMTIEIEILEKYLNVQKLRFEDRFNFEIVADPELLSEEIYIPPMITQPFIENAIEHGQLHLKSDGQIRLAFKKLNSNMIQINVIDNGVGRKKAMNSGQKSSNHKSMAINITKERISSLNKKYKTDGDLSFEDFNLEEQTGTIVTITIPYLNNFV